MLGIYTFILGEEEEVVEVNEPKAGDEKDKKKENVKDKKKKKGLKFI